MLSIGDLIDKLIIENVKLFTLREKLHGEKLTDEEYAQLYDKIMILNENRGIICNHLDEKVNNVVSGKEKNVVLKKIKTYRDHKS
jgi:regulatory protein YycI of two-component signal transduction system YycFG